MTSSWCTYHQDMHCFFLFLSFCLISSPSSGCRQLQLWPCLLQHNIFGVASNLKGNTQHSKAGRMRRGRVTYNNSCDMSFLAATVIVVVVVTVVHRHWAESKVPAAATAEEDKALHSFVFNWTADGAGISMCNLYDFFVLYTLQKRVGPGNQKPSAAAISKKESERCTARLQAGWYGIAQMSCVQKWG